MLKAYWVRRSELAIEYTIAVYCAWVAMIIIPHKLHQMVQAELHTGHSNIVHMKVIRRCDVWWPGTVSNAN